MVTGYDDNINMNCVQILSLTILLLFIYPICTFDKNLIRKHGSFAINQQKYNTSHFVKNRQSHDVDLNNIQSVQARHLLSKIGANVSDGYGFYADSRCSVEMFGGDSNAFWACVTEYALMRNWFPSPIAGLFYKSYLDWNGFDGFWQNGAVLETLVNYMHYTGSKRYQSVFKFAGRDLNGLLHAYFPTPSFDDEGWYGVAYARIYEVTGNVTYLNSAEDVYNWMWNLGWDNTSSCSGGMWFGTGHGKKITITNGQTLLLSAKLYRFLKKTEYLDRAFQQLDYLKKQVISNSSFLSADSIDALGGNCTALPKFNVTYNSGMIMGGLVELYKATGDKSHLILAHKLARALIKENSNEDGVLLEYCEWDNQCVNDDDGRQFKGIFARNLRYLMDVSEEEDRKFYQNCLQKSVNSALSKGQCLDDITKCNVKFLDGPSMNPTQGPVFTTSWAGPFSISDVIAQASVLDLFISAIGPNTTCTDLSETNKTHGCDFDPPFPDIEPIKCTSNPCPPKHPCCTWDTIYATCCMPYQTCYNGGCY